MKHAVTPLQVRNRSLRAQVQQVGPVGQYVVACRCGWQRRANGRAQATSLKASHDRGHAGQPTPPRVPGAGGDAA